MNILSVTAEVNACPPDATQSMCPVCKRVNLWPAPSRMNITPPFVSKGRWVSMQKIVCQCGVIFAKFFPAQVAANLYEEK